MTRRLLLTVLAALALAATACNPRDANDGAMPPADEPTAVAPPAETTPEPLPPLQNTDPCTGLAGTELDDCLRRQTDQVPPPVTDPTQVPPPDPEEPQDTPPEPN